MRTVLTALALAASTVLVPVTTATPASAACAPENDKYTVYKFQDVAVSNKASNLKSDYLQGPGTINYTSTKTASVDASVTATVSAEAGVVFAKASTSLGVTVGKSWSKSGSWSYSKPVPKGKTARLVMFHETRLFTVTKLVWSNADCNYKRKYRSRANAPIMSSSANVWRLQYK